MRPDLADDLTLFGTGVSLGPFLVALLSGLLLAYCFQWLLTNLSVAIGASALRGVTDPGKRAVARRKSEEKERARLREGKPKEFDRDEGGWDDTAIKVESGIGAWAMITSSIALFLACWLAVELIRLQGNIEAVILGLVIWSAFLGSMMYIESAAASSLLGLVTRAVKGGVNTALSPLRAAAKGIGEGQERKETVKTAEEVAAVVRRELFPEARAEGESADLGPGLKEKIRGFVNQNVKPKVMDIADVGRQAKSLLTDPELVEMAKRGELQDLDRRRFAEMVAGRTDLSKEQIEKLTDSLHGAWDRFLGESGAPAPEPTTADYAPGTALATAGSGPTSSSVQGGILAKYKGFKEFLRNTGREELSPERLEQEVKTLVIDPRLGISQLREHLKQLDRESLVQALGQRKDMTPEEASRIADQIELARGRALSAKEQAEHRAQEARDRALSKVRDYVYSLNRPELDYEGFEGDFKKLFDDPKAGYEDLKARLQGLDRETVIAVLSSRENVSRADAEKMVAHGESVLQKAETAKAKVIEAKDQAAAGIEKVADRILEAKETVLERARQVEE
ncbi:MAG TPA: hypothetical protein VK465_04540, partial [Fibrobacteria bacterium]|nr:hypothetical protein [Fibrobacteria bacterium]